MVALALLLLAEIPTFAQAPATQAQSLAHIGSYELHLNRLTDAEANCDAALKLDPSNMLAKQCLEDVALLLIDRDLNSAEASLDAGNRDAARALAGRWTNAAAGSRENRARDIVRRARRTTVSDGLRGIQTVYFALVPPWLRQVLSAVVVLSLLITLLALFRTWWRARLYGVPHSAGGQARGSQPNGATPPTARPSANRPSTRWTMMPLREVPLPPNGQTCVATDAFLDALSRMGDELRRCPWSPGLLLLRPTPPAEYEPAVITHLLCDHLPSIVLTPPAQDISQELEYHSVELDNAVQGLQLRAGELDLGSVARFLSSIVKWFSAGSPSISGIAETESDKSVSIHVVAHRGESDTVAVRSATAYSPGLDAIQLSAERTAFKFLFRMRHRDLTNDEVDGIAALRQGAELFAQYAETVPGQGDDAKTRKASLAKAAYSFGFFRSSVPPNPCPEHLRNTSRDITDETRQSALLAEGVAHALVGSGQDRMAAIACFRQLQDWPNADPHSALKRQAAYNEAIVWRNSGAYARCVLLLTDLLGERAPDTISKSETTKTATDCSRPKTVEEALGHKDAPRLVELVSRDPVLLGALLARLAAFACYSRQDWSMLPEGRADILLDDAGTLITILRTLLREPSLSALDQRLIHYMYAEALRCAGHVMVLRIITGPGKALYNIAQRPLGLLCESLSDHSVQYLKEAREWMLECEKMAPTCGLYCDLAQANLFIKDFRASQGYARHATLEKYPENEFGSYLAAEAYFIQAKILEQEGKTHESDEALVLSRKYAFEFSGDVTLAEFQSLRSDLQRRRDQQLLSAAPAPGVPAISERD
jgi:hypothetical protein